MRTSLKGTHFVAFGAEHDLSMWQPLWAEDLVHLGQGNRSLFEHGVGQHVSGTVLAAQPLWVETTAAYGCSGQLTVLEAVGEIARNSISSTVQVFKAEFFLFWIWIVQEVSGFSFTRMNIVSGSIPGCSSSTPSVRSRSRLRSGHVSMNCVGPTALDGMKSDICKFSKMWRQGWGQGECRRCRVDPGQERRGGDVPQVGGVHFILFLSDKLLALENCKLIVLPRRRHKMSQNVTSDVTVVYVWWRLWRIVRKLITFWLEIGNHRFNMKLLNLFLKIVMKYNYIKVDLVIFHIFNLKIQLQIINLIVLKLMLNKLYIKM